MQAGFALAGRLFLAPGRRISDFMATVSADRGVQDISRAGALLPSGDVQLEELDVSQVHAFVWWTSNRG